MKREQIMKKYKCSLADACIIENIVNVSTWNKNTNNKDMKINYKTGFVMPLFHGFDYKKTKLELIKKYAYIGI